MATPGSGHSVQPYWIYNAVWITLLVFTVVTVAAARVNLGGWNVPLALAIASTKAVLVGLFFMHLRFEGRWVWGFAVFSIFLLLPVIAVTVMDALHGLVR